MKLLIAVVPVTAVLGMASVATANSREGKFVLKDLSSETSVDLTFESDLFKLQTLPDGPCIPSLGIEMECPTKKVIRFQYIPSAPLNLKTAALSVDLKKTPQYESFLEDAKKTNELHLRNSVLFYEIHKTTQKDSGPPNCERELHQDVEVKVSATEDHELTFENSQMIQLQTEEGDCDK